MALLPAPAALWLLLAAAPVAIWAAMTDLREMRIPNRAVYALVAAFAVIGVLALPLEVWLWRWAHLGVVLVVGFLMNMLRLMGAGDAKFAAAMAPFVALGDVAAFALILAAVLLATFIAQRLARAMPVARRLAPGWASWERREFPMGVALGPALIIYLALAAGL